MTICGSAKFRVVSASLHRLPIVCVTGPVTTRAIPRHVVVSLSGQAFYSLRSNLDASCRPKYYQPQRHVVSSVNSTSRRPRPSYSETARTSSKLAYTLHVGDYLSPPDDDRCVSYMYRASPIFLDSISLYSLAPTLNGVRYESCVYRAFTERRGFGVSRNFPKKNVDEGRVFT